MKNIDKIRSLSVEKLAEIMCRAACGGCLAKDLCTRYLTEKKGKKILCYEVILEWLNQNVNPMPKLEVGDLIDANSWRYVAIGNDIVVNPSGMGKFCLSSMKDIKTIWRYKVNRYEAIWRADNEKREGSGAVPEL